MLTHKSLQAKAPTCTPSPAGVLAVLAAMVHKGRAGPQLLLQLSQSGGDPGGGARGAGGGDGDGGIDGDGGDAGRGEEGYAHPVCVVCVCVCVCVHVCLCICVCIWVRASCVLCVGL